MFDKNHMLLGLDDIEIEQAALQFTNNCWYWVNPAAKGTQLKVILKNESMTIRTKSQHNFTICGKKDKSIST